MKKNTNTTNANENTNATVNTTNANESANTNEEEKNMNENTTTTTNENKRFHFESEVTRTLEKSRALSGDLFFGYLEPSKVEHVYVFEKERPGKGLDWKKCSRSLAELVTSYSTKVVMRGAIRMFYEKQIDTLEEELEELREELKLSSNEEESRELEVKIREFEAACYLLREEEKDYIRSEGVFEFPEELVNVYKQYRKDNGSWSHEVERLFLTFTSKFGACDLRKTDFYARIVATSDFKTNKSDNAVLRERFKNGVSGMLNKNAFCTNIMVRFHDAMLNSGCINSPELTATMKRFYKEAKQKKQK